MKNANARFFLKEKDPLLPTRNSKPEGTFQVPICFASYSLKVPKIRFGVTENPVFLYPMICLVPKHPNHRELCHNGYGWSG